MPENLITAFCKLIEFYKNGTPTDDEEIIDFIKKSSLEEILKNKSF